MSAQPELRPGAVIDGDTVVCQLPDGDWLLVAPSHTFRRLEWGCYGERIGADGTGRENTDAMLAAGSPAAAYCRAALGKPYDLPSRGELAMLYQQRDLLGLEGLGWAWSSTENSSFGSWLQRFSDGVQSNGIKNYESWVVPVRRVSPAQAAEAEAAKLRERRDALRAAISDPESVFVNMKRGAIAKPSMRSMIDLYGEVVNGDEAQLLEIAKLRAEVERLQRELATAHADASHYASAAEDMRQQASRYERLRRLNPHQFAELHQRNLAGERFDDMVDAP